MILNKLISTEDPEEPLVDKPENVSELGKVLQQTRVQFPGRILKVELDDEDDAPSGLIYEVKVLQDNGAVIEVVYDAKTLKVLEVEGDDWKSH